MAIGIGDISLQDVVDYLDVQTVLPAGTLYDGNGDYTLDRCFKNTFSYAFDPTYGYSYGSTYSLYEFKNYDHTATQSTTFTYGGNIISGIYVITVGSNSGTEAISIDTNGKWIVAGAFGGALPTWISINPGGVQPPGTDVIYINYEQNTGASSRSATIFVFGEYEILDNYNPALIRINFTQEGVA